MLTTWDPDGAGPQTPRIVVGGTFAAAGSASSQLVALLDPATGQWSSLGGGVRDAASSFGNVLTAVTMPNGDLVVGGRFTEAGGSPAQSIARWNGTSWSALGLPPFTNWVFSLQVLPNGNLAAAGDSGVIGVWDGSTWTWLLPGFSNAVYALALATNGDLLAAGYTSSSFSSSGVRRWNGSVWTSLGPSSGAFDANIRKLLVMPNGDVVATGAFSGASTPNTPGVARWNGSSWVAMGNGLSGIGFATPSVTGLVPLSNGNLLAAGSIGRSGTTPLADLAEWNGSTWVPYAGGLAGAASALEWSPGAVFVTGQFAMIGGAPVGHIARWNGATWSPVDAGGTQGDVRAMTRMANGDVVVGGAFSRLGQTNVANIARWNGSTWLPFGSGTGAQVAALVTMPNGDVVAGGYYSHAGGVQVNNIARWNGTSWTSFGSGTNGGVLGLAVLTNGDLIATGEFTAAGGNPALRIARWDGTSWSPLGAGLSTTLPYAAGKCLALLPSGALVVGGQFELAGGISARNIASWDGSSWSSLGPPLTFNSMVVNAMAVEADGGLMVGGTAYGPSSTLRRWDGTSWTDQTTSYEDIASLLALPNGSLLAGGSFPAFRGQPAMNLAMRTGSNWSQFGGTDTRVRTMMLQPDGEVVIGGDFSTAGGVQAARIAHAVPGCPASASLLPTTCVGPAGPLTLAATTRPFVGATFRARTFGYAATAFGASVIGFSTVNVPLSIVDPAALPGCDLLVSPDVVMLATPNSGQTTQELVLPNTPTLVGGTFSHQVVQLDAPGTPAWSLSTSNGLTLVVGAL